MKDTPYLSLSPVTVASATAQSRGLLEDAQRRLGFVPNMYAAMANSPGLLDTYMHGYARFRQDSGFSAAEQEVVFLTISRENGCHYCVAAHSVIADAMSKVPVEVTNAIRDGRPIREPRLGALSRFTKAMVQSRGMPDRREVEAFVKAGFTERQVLEIVLAIAVKTLSNYANHLFHTPVDEKFASRKWHPDMAEAG
jgi:uncharacterized peroxidase-related enzyme